MKIMSISHNYVKFYLNCIIINLFNACYIIINLFYLRKNKMLKSKFLNDFSKVAQGAFSTMNAIREELDVMVKSRLERVLVSKGLVTQEEHDIILLRVNNLNMKIDGLEAKIDNHSKQLKELTGTKKNKKG